jgi:hypothetical protein
MLTKRRMTVGVILLTVAAIYVKVNFTGPRYQAKQAAKELRRDALFTQRPTTRNYTDLTPLRVAVERRNIEVGPYRTDLSQDLSVDRPLTGLNDLLNDWESIVQDTGWEITEACKMTFSDGEMFSLELQRRHGARLYTGAIRHSSPDEVRVSISTRYDTGGDVNDAPPISEQDLQKSAMAKTPNAKTLCLDSPQRVAEGP